MCVFVRERERGSDSQTHRHTDTQTHRHTDTQTHTHTHIVCVDESNTQKYTLCVG